MLTMFMHKISENTLFFKELFPNNKDKVFIKQIK